MGTNDLIGTAIGGAVAIFAIDRVGKMVERSSKSSSGTRRKAKRTPKKKPLRRKVSDAGRKKTSRTGPRKKTGSVRRG